MLDEGADPTTGSTLVVGPIGVRHDGQGVLIAALSAPLIVKATFAEIMPATNVPCPLFAALLKPRPSPTKSSPPMTEPSSVRCGKFGRRPESITATFMP